MKAKALLVSKEGSASNATIAEAVVRADMLLLKATDAKRAFELLRDRLAEVDLVIIDLDPGIHGMAILEALTARSTSPPVIVVTGLEQTAMMPIARRHGAAACIAKPFTAAEFVARIENVCPAEQSSVCTCDSWGHPYPSRHKTRDRQRTGSCEGCTPHRAALAGAEDFS